MSVAVEAPAFTLLPVIELTPEAEAPGCMLVEPDTLATSGLVALFCKAPQMRCVKGDVQICQDMGGCQYGK